MIGLLLLAVSSVLAGQLSPMTAHPIALSSNNSQQPCDYTFTFNIQTPVPGDGSLVAVFPPASYDAGLGVASCVADNGAGLSYSCSISGTTATISVGQLSSAPSTNSHKVVLRKVINPTVVGVTGMFRLYTASGINPIDYNDFFGQVGIVTLLPSFGAATVSCSGSCLSGTTDTYSVSFTLAVALPSEVKMTITAPVTLTFQAVPTCTSTLWPGLTCTLGANNAIALTQTTPGVTAGTTIIVQFTSVSEPAYSGSVGSFSIYAIDPILNNVFIDQSGIPGPSLGANSISTPSVCPNAAAPCSPTENYVSISNRMDFTLTFVTTNPIPSNGAVKVTFPAAFGTLESENCLLQTGFTNLGYTRALLALCTVDNAAKTLTLTSIGVVNAGICRVRIRATAPGASGAYGPFTVTSYTDTTLAKVVDTVTAGSVSVAAMNAMPKWEVTWGGPLIAGTAVSMTILLRPYTTIPIPSIPTSAITMRFVSSFSVTAALASVFTPHNFYPPQTLTPTAVASLYTFPLQAGPNTIPNNGDSFLDVTAGGSNIQLPATPGDYAIQMCINIAGTDTDAFQHWVTVLGAPFSAGSVFHYAYDVGKPTVYSISFTPTMTVPDGKVPQLVTSTWGSIDVQFPTMNANWQTLYATDLGTGQTADTPLSCTGIASISPTSGASDLICELLPAASVAIGQYSTVRIYNFASLPPQVPVTLHIANICNAQTAGITATLTVTTYTVIQRLYTPLNQQTFTLPGTFYQTPSASLPIYNGRSPAPIGDNLNKITLTPADIGVTTQMDFVFWPEYSLTAGQGNSFIFKFPPAYPLPSSGVACFINYATSTPCYTYTVAGWLVFTAPSLSMIQHIEYTLTATGLVNPPHLLPVSTLSMVSVLNKIIMEYVEFEGMPDLIPGAVNPVSLTADSYAALAIDTTYTFIFTFQHNVAQGGSIVFTFPKRNYVLTTFPAPTCVVMSGLVAVSSSFGCSVASAAVTLTNFKAYTGGSSITVRILHVLNPSTEGTTLNFSITSQNSLGYIQDANYLIAGIRILAGVGLGKLQHTSFGASPANGNLVATLQVGFLPSVSYPAQSVIQVTLPPETAILASSPVCLLSGGLSTLSGCSKLDDHVLSLITDTAFVSVPSALPIVLSIASMKNFAPGLTSGVVTIAVTYSSTSIDESPDDETNRRYTTTDEVSTLLVSGLTHYPLSAAEQATYQFTITPQSPLYTNCTMNIAFPAAFPRRLNSWVTCFSPELSGGLGDTGISCYVEERTLILNGTVDFFPPGSFNLTVMRVINPNPSEVSGQWLFYTQCGTQIKDYSVYEDTTTPASIPAPLAYQSLAASNPYSGFFVDISLTASGSFGFNTNAEDRLFVDFGSVYDLTYTGKDIVCQAMESTAIVPCAFAGGRITISAFSSVTAVTSLSLALSLVQNPYLIGELPYPTFSYYQASTRTVLAKTVPNLALVPSFSLTKLGQYLTVNGNANWSQNRGTRTGLIPIRLETYATSDFTATAMPSEGVTVHPTVLAFKTGDQVQSFQVSVSQQIATGLALIKWLVGQSALSPQYAPIKVTAFYVTDNKDETISLEGLGSVALGGRSPPITVSLSSAPDSYLSVSIVKLGVTPTEVAFLPSLLKFSGGEKTHTFEIVVNSTSTGITGELILYKEGDNHESYILLQSVYTYGVAQKDAIPPVAVSAKLTAVTRNTAAFTVIMNEPCTLYVMAALYGTRALTMQEALAGRLNNTEGISGSQTFNSTATYTTISSNRYQYTFQMSNLTAQTKYVLHVLPVDFGGTPAVVIPSVNFTTDARMTPVYFNLTFSSSQQGQDELIRKNIASVLSISIDLVDILHDLSYLATSSSRALQSSYIVTVAIWGNPTDPSALTPAQYAALLQSQFTALHGLMPTFDLSSQLRVNTLAASKPAFATTPTVSAVTPQTLTLGSLALIANGTIYICLIPASITPHTPTSYQIVHGTDSSNLPCNVSLSQASANSERQSQDVSDLVGGLNYWVYFSAANGLPRYPDLLDDSNIVAISARVVAPAATGQGLCLRVALALWIAAISL